MIKPEFEAEYLKRKTKARNFYKNISYESSRLGVLLYEIFSLKEVQNDKNYAF